jgi:hypothetical protein
MSVRSAFTRGHCEITSALVDIERPLPDGSLQCNEI